MIHSEELINAVFAELDGYVELNNLQAMELDMLLDLGITPGDVHSAVQAWTNSSKVRDDWGYLRTVLFARQAEWRLRKLEFDLAARDES